MINLFFKAKKIARIIGILFLLFGAISAFCSCTKPDDDSQCLIGNQGDCD